MKVLNKKLKCKISAANKTKNVTSGTFLLIFLKFSVDTLKLKPITSVRRWRWILVFSASSKRRPAPYEPSSWTPRVVFYTIVSSAHPVTRNRLIYITCVFFGLVFLKTSLFTYKPQAQDKFITQTTRMKT